MQMLIDLGYQYWISVFPTMLGYVILVGSSYFMLIKPNKQKFWGFFTIGSLMMSSGMIVAYSSASHGVEIGSSILVSGIVWCFHVMIFFTANKLQEYYKTAYQLGLNAKDVSDIIVISDEQFFIVKHDAFNSKPNYFRYKLLAVQKVDTYLNKWRGEQHYVQELIENDFESVNDCKTYIESFCKVPVMLRGSIQK